VSVLILPRLRAAAGRPGLRQLIDEARRRARERRIRALALTLAVFGLALGAFFLLDHGGVGVPWRASGSDRPDQAPLTVGAVADKRAWVVVQGSAPVAPGEKLFLVYADGARERLKVTWGRKQVRPGLSYICQCYHHVIPRVHRAYSRRPIAVELMHGRRTVARQALLPPSG
jgi:hypothetical protein